MRSGQHHRVWPSSFPLNPWPPKTYMALGPVPLPFGPLWCCTEEARVAPDEVPPQQKIFQSQIVTAPQSGKGIICAFSQ
jgi:hypothetical protein